MLAIAGLGSLLSGLADDLNWIIARRALQGTSMAILPLCVGLVREHWPRERVSVAIGVLTATYSIGAGIGFIIGGVFFWFSAALALLTLMLAVWLVPASPRATRTGRTDVVGG